jgi:hypothetical protein
MLVPFSISEHPAACFMGAASLGHFTNTVVGEGPFGHQLAADEFRNTLDWHLKPILLQLVTPAVKKPYNSCRSGHPRAQTRWEKE